MTTALDKINEAADLNVGAMRQAEDIARTVTDEHLAGWVVHEVCRKFGWTYATLGRVDVEDYACRPLTDEEWDKVRWSKTWTDYLPPTEGWTEILFDLLGQLGIECAE